MAITDIIATVLANTNSTPTSNSIEDAQKYGEKHGIPFLSGDDILIASGLKRGDKN